MSAPFVGNQLVLAWQGMGNSQLNTIVSNDGGKTFSGQIVSGQSSRGGPAMANGVIAWTSTTNAKKLNVATLTK
jgi:hypothetical protein